MPERLGRKEPDIGEEIDRFLQDKQTEKVLSPELRLPRQWAWRESSYTRYAYLTRALVQNWLEIFNKARELPLTEFYDEITELRQEIDSLSVTVNSLTQELASSRKRTDELSKKVDEIHSRVETNTVAKLCQAYVKIVSNIDMAKKVLVAETMDVATIWTIIDAPPFEDSLRTPIYDAQLRILSTLKEHVPLDFNVLNVSELPKKQEPNDIIPANAKLVWER
jgi:FtsZ-binding cell division protein ZapB